MFQHHPLQISGSCPLLSFLNDSLHDRHTSGNMDDRGDLTEDPSEQSVVLDLHAVPDEHLQESPASCSVAKSPTAGSCVMSPMSPPDCPPTPVDFPFSKRKCTESRTKHHTNTEISGFEDQRLGIMQKESDDDKHWCLSLAAKMKMLYDEQNKVAHLFHEIRFANS